jgi:hypothetical protein
MAEPEKEPEELTPSEETTEEEEQTPQEPEPEPEPKTRMSAASHIIERKQKKIEKLQKKDDGGEEGEEEGEELTPEGETAIQKAVEASIAPLRETITRQADEQELLQVLGSHKEDEVQVPESVLRKYVGHPSYKDVSISFIYSGLQAEYQRRAAQKKKAEEEAEGGSLPGAARRPAGAGKLPDFSAMSDDEFSAWEREHNRGE